ncbi:MAG: type II toxin-antitoxin system HicB family antitoxin [Actinomycetota bacterium]
MKVKVYLEYDFEYDGFIADCPTLPGCMSQGKTKEEAINNIKEAIAGYLKVARKHRKTIPVEEPCYVEVAV